MIIIHIHTGTKRGEKYFIPWYLNLQFWTMLLWDHNHHYDMKEARRDQTTCYPRKIVQLLHNWKTKEKMTCFKINIHLTIRIHILQPQRLKMSAYTCKNLMSSSYYFTTRFCFTNWGSTTEYIATTGNGNQRPASLFLAFLQRTYM